MPICTILKPAKHSENPPLVANKLSSGHNPRRIPNIPTVPSLWIGASGSGPLATPVHPGS